MCQFWYLFSTPVFFIIRPRSRRSPPFVSFHHSLHHRFELSGLFQSGNIAKYLQFSSGFSGWYYFFPLLSIWSSASFNRSRLHHNWQYSLSIGLLVGSWNFLFYMHTSQCWIHNHVFTSLTFVCSEMYLLFHAVSIAIIAAFSCVNRLCSSHCKLYEHAAQVCKCLYVF